MTARDEWIAHLCFHGIGTPSRPTEPGEEKYWISREFFYRILDLVAEDQRVRISFDDGNISDVEVGLPALIERGMSATFFVLAGRMDQPGSLSGAEVGALASSGMRIGSHGMDHRPWRGLGTDDLDRELIDARDMISAAAGTAVTEAALPLGRYDRTVLTRARQAGYTRLHSSDRTWARSRSWLQPRFSIRAEDTVESLRQEMLTPPPIPHRAQRAAVIALKRLR